MGGYALGRIVLAVVLVALCVVHSVPARAAAIPGGDRVVAYYYLWWSLNHWQDKLGPSFPYTASPLPLPATIGPSGCGAVSLYAGNQLTDVPARLTSQDDPGVIEQDVRTAASHGLNGFLVSWTGTGAATQTVASSSYNRRLDALVAAVRRVRSEGIPFVLWLGYGASTPTLTSTQISNDLAYLERAYAADPVLDRAGSGRPILVWIGSRKYPLSTIQQVSQRFRSTFFLVGDENWKTWGDGRGAYLDGDQYYWSSQNPYSNAASFDQLATLAASVRGSGPNPDGSPKRWFAPVVPGFDNTLLVGRSGTCVPRNGSETMSRIVGGNARSNPDGWVVISWNEIAEGTYVQPLQRWGTSTLEALRSIFAGRADRTPPSVPAGLAATPSALSASIDLSWTPATDDVGVTGYDVYRDGHVIGATSGATSFRDSSPAPGAPHTYQVRARDGAGNVSELSPGVVATAGAVLFTDGFEGGLGAWTGVTGIVVQSAERYSGSQAARASSAGLPAYAYVRLGSDRPSLRASVRFKILAQTTGSLDLLRLRTGGGQPLVTVYRTESGKLSYRNSVTGVSTYSTTIVTLGTWHLLETRARLGPDLPGVEVLLDGVRVDQLSLADAYGAATVGRVQIGVDATGRRFDVVFDDVYVSDDL